MYAYYATEDVLVQLALECQKRWSIEWRRPINSDICVSRPCSDPLVQQFRAIGDLQIQNVQHHENLSSQVKKALFFKYHHQLARK